MNRIWHIERDENGAPTRMLWGGDVRDEDRPRCAMRFRTRGGDSYHCRLPDRHKGQHEFFVDRYTDC